MRRVRPRVLARIELPRPRERVDAWVPASGTGEVFTYTVFHHAYDPRFADRVPYTLAVVQLDEGPFFHTDVVGVRRR